MMAGQDFDQIPYQQEIVDRDGRATPWFQSLWQRMTNGIPKTGTGSYGATSGAVAIPHGFPSAPNIASCSVQPIASSSIVATLVSTDATHLNVRLWVSSTGAVVADGGYSLRWQAARS